jgi:hypothetical protein
MCFGSMGEATVNRIMLSAIAIAVASVSLTMSTLAAEVGVSIGIAQPGVYGRIDIGRFPQPPAVVAPRPVVIEQPHVVVAKPIQPVYLWVPPGHQKNWAKHCRQYSACGVPVYFVRDEWYQDKVMGSHGNNGHSHSSTKGKGHGKK